jgi:hypothetical protein
MKPGQFLIDLVGIAKVTGSDMQNYEGICW